MGMDCFAPSQLPATDADQLWVETDYPCSKNTAAFVNGAWVRKLRQVDQCEQFAMSKHATSQRINGARDQRELSTFTWDGSTFDADIDSQRRLQGAVQLAQIALQAGQSYSAPWRLADNTLRTLSAQDLIQVGIALGQHVLNVHLIARQLKSQAAAATTTTELDNIKWPQP